MNKIFERSKVCLFVALFSFASLNEMAYAAQSTAELPQGPALYLTIKYYDRALTAEGVLRESHHEDTMLRRPGHVWLARVLPKFATEEHGAHSHHEHDAEHGDKHFNPVILPRHISLNGSDLKIEFIDRTKKEAINIVATEYENVDFDGSWTNAYFLVDPRLVMAMPLSGKTSAIADASWHELEKNGVYQRVLWDDKNMIPLEVETGRRDGTLLRKVSVKIESHAGEEVPWSNLKGYTQKEYSDFLD